MSINDPLLAPITGGKCPEVGGARIDMARAGACRVKRVIYLPGFRWSTHMKAIVVTDLCVHVHVRFLARSHAEGCTLQFVVPQAVAIEPGHDGCFVGDETAVVIEFDSKVTPSVGLGCRSGTGTGDGRPSITSSGAVR